MAFERSSSDSSADTVDFTEGIQNIIVILDIKLTKLKCAAFLFGVCLTTQFCGHFGACFTSELLPSRIISCCYFL